MGEGTLAGMSWAGQCERGTRRGCGQTGARSGMWRSPMARTRRDIAMQQTRVAVWRERERRVLWCWSWSWSYSRPEVRCRDLKLPGSASLASMVGHSRSRHRSSIGDVVHQLTDSPNQLPQSVHRLVYGPQGLSNGPRKFPRLLEHFLTTLL